MSKQTTPAVDIDAILAANVRKSPGTRCVVCCALAAMPPEWRDKMQAAFDDKVRYSASSLQVALSHLGHDVGRSSVDRHRNRACIGSTRA